MGDKDWLKSIECSHQIW